MRWILFVVVLTPLFAFASGISNLFDWNRALVLPAGQSRFQFIHQYSAYDQKYNSDGQLKPLGQSYSHSVSWKELLEHDEGSLDKQSIEKYLKSKGQSINDSVATNSFEIDQKTMSFNFNWSHGLTSFWTIGVSIPFRYSETTIRTNTQVADSYENVFPNEGPRDRKLQRTIDNKVKKLVGEHLKSTGFDPLKKTTEQSQLGDVELKSKVALFRSKRYFLSTRQSISFPSAANQDPYEFVDMSYGDGQTDLEMAFLADLKLTSSSIINVWTSYRYQMPTERSVRVPRFYGDPISKDVDLGAEVDLGDRMASGIKGILSLNSIFSVAGGYTYIEKQRDQVSGSEFSTRRYEHLEEGTNQQVHLANLRLQYTPELFKIRNRVRQQVTAALIYESVVSGKNIEKQDSASLNVSLYY